MKAWKKVVAAVGGTLVIGAVIAGWLAYDAYRQTQETPDFYEAALAVPPQRIEELHAEVEQSFQRLETIEAEAAPPDSEIEADDPPPPTWEWSVSDAQANAWLAQEAPEYLRKGKAPLSDPRVEFEDGVARVAVRYEDSRFASVLSGDLRVNLDPETGKVEAQLTGVRSGALAIPLDWAKERIEKAIARIKWPIRAATEQNSISAETDIPDEGFVIRDGRRLLPTEIVVEPDRLIVRGIVVDEELAADAAPVSIRIARGS